MHKAKRTGSDFIHSHLGVSTVTPHPQEPTTGADSTQSAPKADQPAPAHDVVPTEGYAERIARQVLSMAPQSEPRGTPTEIPQPLISIATDIHQQAGQPIAAPTQSSLSVASLESRQATATDRESVSEGVVILKISKERSKDASKADLKKQLNVIFDVSLIDGKTRVWKQWPIRGKFMKKSLQDVLKEIPSPSSAPAVERVKFTLNIDQDGDIPLSTTVTPDDEAGFKRHKDRGDKKIREAMKENTNAKLEVLWEIELEYRATEIPTEQEMDIC